LLKLKFGWLFQGTATTSVRMAYVYADEALPGWAILGDYDNGSASGAGRSEYIWLPTPGLAWSFCSSVTTKERRVSRILKLIGVDAESGVVHTVT